MRLRCCGTVSVIVNTVKPLIYLSLFSRLFWLWSWNGVNIDRGIWYKSASYRRVGKVKGFAALCTVECLFMNWCIWSASDNGILLAMQPKSRCLSWCCWCLLLQVFFICLHSSYCWWSNGLSSQRRRNWFTLDFKMVCRLQWSGNPRDWEHKT